MKRVVCMAARSLKARSSVQEQVKTVNKCKIVATIGPASSSPQIIEQLMIVGVNIFRLNFSHGDHAMHLANIKNIRSIAQNLQKRVAILQDLQGPKIRVGKLINDSMQVIEGESYELEYGVNQRDPKVIPVDYRGLVYDVRAGDLVMMDDGLIICDVEAVKSDSLVVKMKVGGLLKNRKGVNFPSSKLSLPAMTDKDSKDLLFGITHHVDMVALSFVQSPADIEQIKSMIQVLGADIPVIAKIEKLSAIDQIEEITKLSDGIMVARGDLGVEAGVEKVPNLQKIITKTAKKFAKPVIVATQMLESMIQNPRATLAEVADVANGVLDNADCLMLSGEVASGKYPVESVERMASIIQEVENWKLSRNEPLVPGYALEKEWQEHESIARAACEAAEAINAKAIVCLTLTGSIARLIARWRPKAAIIAVSPREDIVNRLAMVWGVYGIRNPSFYNTDTLLQDLPKLLKDLDIVSIGDTIVITAGIPLNQMRPTNMMKIDRIP